MSALTDYFTSLANKLRSKTGKSATMTPTEMVDEVDVVYQAGKSSVTSQSKSATPTTSAQNIEPDSGYDFLSSVSVGAIQTQTKSATPTTTAQTITPDSGKFLSSVSVGAIQTQEKTAPAIPNAISYANGASITPDSGKFLSKVNIPKPFGGNTNSFVATTPLTGSTAVRVITFDNAGIYLLVAESWQGSGSDPKTRSSFAIASMTNVESLLLSNVGISDISVYCPYGIFKVKANGGRIGFSGMMGINSTTKVLVVKLADL